MVGQSRLHDFRPDVAHGGWVNIFQERTVQRHDLAKENVMV